MPGERGRELLGCHHIHTIPRPGDRLLRSRGMPGHDGGIIFLRVKSDFGHHRCNAYGHYQSNCPGVAKAQGPERIKRKGKGKGGDPSPKLCSDHKLNSHSDSACYKQKQPKQLAAYFESVTTADRARVADVGSAHIPQTSQPDPQTIRCSFTVMGASLVDAAASSTTSGSSPAELVPKPAPSATPTI